MLWVWLVLAVSCNAQMIPFSNMGGVSCGVAHEDNLYFGVKSGGVAVHNTVTGEQQVATHTLLEEVSSCAMYTEGPAIIGVFGTYTTPGRVVLVNMTSLDVLTSMNISRGGIITVVVSDEDGVAYMATDDEPTRGTITAVDISGGVLRELTVQQFSSGVLVAAEMDAVSGHTYWAVYLQPTNIVVTAGSISSIGTRAFQTGEQYVGRASSTKDSVERMMYLGTNTTPGVVHKYDMANGGARGRRDDAFRLPTGEGDMGPGFYYNDSAYFLLRSPDNAIVRLIGAPLNRTGILALPPAPLRPTALLGLQSTGNIYVAFDSGGAGIYRVSAAATYTETLQPFTPPSVSGDVPVVPGELEEEGGGGSGAAIAIVILLILGSVVCGLAIVYKREQDAKAAGGGSYHKEQDDAECAPTAVARSSAQSVQNKSVPPDSSPADSQPPAHNNPSTHEETADAPTEEEQLGSRWGDRAAPAPPVLDYDENAAEQYGDEYEHDEGGVPEHGEEDVGYGDERGFWATPIPQVTLSLPDVPVLVVSCVDWMLEKGLDTEGVFRIPASKDNSERLLAEFVSGARDNVDDVYDAIEVAGLLKLWAKKSYEAPFPSVLYPKLSEAVLMDEEADRKAKLEANRAILEALPHNNYEVCERLVRLFVAISKNWRINKMKPSNMAMVYGPTYFRKMNIGEATNILSYWIANYDSLFL